MSAPRDKPGIAAYASVMTVFRSFTDFSVGDRFDLGSYVLTREEIVDFAAEFDPQPFHLDEAAAKASMLGGLCASGWHGCAILMRIFYEGLIKDSASMGSGGIDEVKWLRPIFPGKLHCDLTITGARVSRSRPEMGILTGRFTLSDSAGETLMRMVGTFMQEVRP